MDRRSSGGRCRIAPSRLRPFCPPCARCLEVESRRPDNYRSFRSSSLTDARVLPLQPAVSPPNGRWICRLVDAPSLTFRPPLTTLEQQRPIRCWVRHRPITPCHGRAPSEAQAASANNYFYSHTSLSSSSSSLPFILAAVNCFRFALFRVPHLHSVPSSRVKRAGSSRSGLRST